MKRLAEFYITKDDIKTAYLQATGEIFPHNMPNDFCKLIAERTMDVITEDVINQLAETIKVELERGAQASYEARYDL